MAESFERFSPQAILFNLGFDQRLATLERALKEARDLQRPTSQDSWGKHRLAAKIEQLETAIENERRERVLRADQKATEDAAQAERIAKADAAREAARIEAERLDKAVERGFWRAANPGSTDAEFEAAWPSILATKAAAKRDQLLASARRQYAV